MLNDGFMATETTPTKPTRPATSLWAIDLTDLPAEKMTALRRAAIARNVPFHELLASIVDEKAAALLGERLETAA